MLEHASDQLSPVVTMLDHAMYICDQTWPDATKCGYASMEGTFVSDLQGCQSEITKIHVFVIKIILKRCVSRDPNMSSMSSLYGKHPHHQFAAADDLGDINRSQTHTQQHLMTSWNGPEVTYIQPCLSPLSMVGLAWTHLVIIGPFWLWSVVTWDELWIQRSAWGPLVMYVFFKEKYRSSYNL